VSGGFGDSNTMDPQTVKILRENQERVERVLATLKPMTQQEWEQQTVTEDYTMESEIF
jgi:hypothetical protein